MVKSSNNRLAYAIGGTLGGLVVVVILLFALLMCRHRRLQATKNHPLSFDEQFAALRAHGFIVEQGATKIREVARRHVKVLETLGQGQYGVVCKGLVNEVSVNNVPEYAVAIKVV
jgi:hypothetical protein